MKLHGKNLLITIGLLLVLGCVLLVEICLFISGPNLRYASKIDEQKEVITSKVEDITNIERHVFSYVVYSGEDASQVYWFNENGELMTKRSKSEASFENALARAKESYALSDPVITYGYGYKNPVYVIEDASAEIYLDIDTMEEVFYRKKGEALT